MVSIIIPAKNEERNIIKVLEALNGAIENYSGECEIILSDNGSTDSTVIIALEYGCKVISDKYANISRLRNLGAKVATEDALGFLDADCLVDPDWINCCMQKLSDKRIGIVGTRAIPDLGNATWVERGWYNLVSGADRPDFPRWIGSSNMFIRAETFREVGGFDEELDTAEDVSICNKVGEKYLVCLEKRVNTIHLRESKTVKEMIKREIWRGKSSIRHLAGKKLNQCKAEILSILAPAAYFAIFVLLVISLIHSKRLSIVCLILLFMMPILLMIRKKYIRNKITDVLPVYAVASIYLGSRAIAILIEVIEIIKVLVRRRLKECNTKGFASK